MKKYCNGCVKAVEDSGGIFYDIMNGTEIKATKKNYCVYCHIGRKALMCKIIRHKESEEEKE